MRRLPVCLVLASLGAVLAPAAASALDADARYALVNGCYDLRSQATGRAVAADIGPFRMQATALGSYLLFGKRGDFLSADGTGRVAAAAAPSEDGDWAVDVQGDAFTLTLPSGRALGTDGAGHLVLGAPGAFTFVKADGCATYPEAQVDVDGAPSTAPGPFGEVKGLVDAHMHWMAYEFLGGKAHCGKPWDRYGVAYALVDCPDHAIPGSPGNLLEAALGGPVTHDPHGWPSFAYWPNYYSETHEASYYKWVERAWRSGLRLFVNLYVDNGVLCTIYPLKDHDCNEMDTVRLEMQRLHELQDYVDAQNGGPGKGWFRIVKDPFEARKAIAAGKMAVVQGIEVSNLFDCQIYNGVPLCDKAKIDKNLDEMYHDGVRSMELVNKFDNAFVGVAGDDGTFGVLTNTGNKIDTGRYLDMKTCQGLDPGEQDKTQLSLASLSALPAAAPAGATGAPGVPGGAAGSALSGLLGAVGGAVGSVVPSAGATGRSTAGDTLGSLLAGQTPLYPPPPHCNQEGLTSLGQYLEERMMAKGMIIDPDHMSVAARDATLDLLEARKYSGVVSSHSWSTPEAYPRIYRLGGFVTPIASDSTQFVQDWQTLKAERDPRFYWGFGWGADMNGFHRLGAPRTGATNPVVYPFKSFDGKQTISRETTGTRTWDINTDGVAQYGLFPDWVQDLRMIAGDQIVTDLGRGAEAYLEMWERAQGVPMTSPFPARQRLTAKGLGKLGLGMGNEALLRSAGQPPVRGAHGWRWTVAALAGRPPGRVFAALTPDGHVALADSTAPRHTALGIGTGDTPPKTGRKIGTRLIVRTIHGSPKRYVFGVHGRKVTFVAVTTGTVAKTPARLRTYLRRAGLS